MSLLNDHYLPDILYRQDPQREGEENHVHDEVNNIAMTSKSQGDNKV